jgi:hypothetical protein
MIYIHYNISRELRKKTQRKTCSSTLNNQDRNGVIICNKLCGFKEKN